MMGEMQTQSLKQNMKKFIAIWAAGVASIIVFTSSIGVVLSGQGLEAVTLYSMPLCVLLF